MTASDTHPVLLRLEAQDGASAALLRQIARDEHVAIIQSFEQGPGECTVTLRFITKFPRAFTPKPDAEQQEPPVG